MSDVFEGPGYWMASDGKWYPPDRHPDSAYRERFAAPPVVETPDNQPSPDALTPPDVPSHAAGAVDAALHERGTPEFPTVELHRDDIADPFKSLADIHRSGSEAHASVAETVSDTSLPNSAANTTSSFSVASNEFTAVTERPVFDGAAPRSVTDAPAQAKAKVQRVEVDHGTVELEIDREQPAARTTQARPSSAPGLSTSTALAVIPSAAPPVGISLVDRLLAAALFCAGVAMIVGTFLGWTSGSLVQTGWDRGDGIATIIAGIVGSAAAGPFYVGFHHVVPKAVAIVSGLVGLVVVALTATSVLFDSEAADTSLASGFFVVAVGALVMTLGGVAHRTDMG